MSRTVSDARKCRTRLPGWPEIIVGLACLSVVAIGGGVGLVRPGMDPVPLGLILAALSGVGGMAVSLRLSCSRHL
jgi:hypothetical protein